MDQEPRLTSTAAELADGLVEFFYGLKEDGYRVGPGHVIGAQSLLVALAAADALPDDPRALKSLIGPIVCSTAREQDAFGPRFDAWVASFSSNASPPDRDPKTLEHSSVGVRGRRLAWDVLRAFLIIGVLLVALAIAFQRVSTFYGPVVRQTAPKMTPKAENAAGGGASPSATPAPVISTLTMDELPRTRARPWGAIPLALAIIVPSILLTLIARLIWGSSPQPFLKRRIARLVPDFRNLRVRASQGRLFDAPAFRRSIPNFRRRLSAGAGRLDVDRTLTETVRHAGLFTPIDAPRLYTPNYLVLVDRAGRRDHQARLADALIDRLVEYDVSVARYDFDGDPRCCYPRAAGAAPLSIPELATQHPRHRLMVFSEGVGLIDPMTAEPGPWTAQFGAWPERALLTLEPVFRWGNREQALARGGFLVAPAGPNGLRWMAERFNGEAGDQIPAALTPATRFPALLLTHPRRWLEADAPPAEDVERLIETVRLYLGEEGYLWLTACAVYPELDWDLTNSLGEGLTSDDGQKLFDEARLATLVRLPWFRHGVMPDWLRERLISGMSAGFEAAVRRLLTEQLQASLDEPSRGSAFSIAWTDRATTGQDVPKPLQDQVFLTFVSGSSPSPLAFRLPLALYAMFQEPAPASPLLDQVIELAARIRRASRWMLVLGIGAVLSWQVNFGNQSSQTVRTEESQLTSTPAIISLLLAIGTAVVGGCAGNLWALVFGAATMALAVSIAYPAFDFGLVATAAVISGGIALAMSSRRRAADPVRQVSRTSRALTLIVAVTAAISSVVIVLLAFDPRIYLGLPIAMIICLPVLGIPAVVLGYCCRNRFTLWQGVATFVPPVGMQFASSISSSNMLFSLIILVGVACETALGALGFSIRRGEYQSGATELVRRARSLATFMAFSLPAVSLGWALLLYGCSLGNATDRLPDFALANGAGLYWGGAAALIGYCAGHRLCFRLGLTQVVASFSMFGAASFME